MVANAVARVDNLEFLTDVVPRTTTFKAYLAKHTKETREAAALSNGQRTLPVTSIPEAPANGVSARQSYGADDMDIDPTTESGPTTYPTNGVANGGVNPQ